MPKQSSIYDNLKHHKAQQFLTDHLDDGADVAVVTAYFTAYAYYQMCQDWDKVEQCRLLFGEPRFIQTVDKKPDALAYEIQESGLTLRQQLQQKQAAKACADWINDKVTIRSMRQNALLHGKLYHITEANGRQHALLGSSNFTTKGLGLGADNQNNIELNITVHDDQDRTDLLGWFNELWHDEQLTEDVTHAVLAYLNKLHRDNAPEFIYYKTLFHLFEAFLAEQDQGHLFEADKRLSETAVWQTLYEFQKDGVTAAINKIKKYNGCIIADSVGLGKTYEALAVIKYFELQNQKVLVLCPKKLRENWTVYHGSNNSALNPFVDDRFNYTVMSHTDLGRESGKSGDYNLAGFYWHNYELVVIDESHNFRNNTKGKQDEDGNRIRKSRYEWLMEEIIQKGVNTKVLLLSATPVNNSLRDLRNQLYFLTAGDDHAFSHTIGIESLKETLANGQRKFTDWVKEGSGNTQKLLEMFDTALFKLLDALTISRSREHIRRYYASTMARLGEFPERTKPVSVYAEIDTNGRFPSYDVLNEQISQYQLSLYNPSAYVKDKFVGDYEIDRVKAFTQRNREHFLIGMMRVNFLKRLESSVHAFGITMQRTIEKIEALESKIETYLAVQNGELDFQDVQPDDPDDDELQSAWEVGEKLTFNLEHLHVEEWLDDLARDREQLQTLAHVAQQVTPDQDAKLQELRAFIQHKVEKPTTDKDGRLNRKTLVFTAFADTATYLYTHLKTWAREALGIHIALVQGSGANQTTLDKVEFNAILTNFAPLAKKRDRLETMPQEEEIDLLIATDCISEGQNLQDCDTIINYDIHWNPVRIIQRFGRIDRLGSRNQQVRLINFWPTDDLNQYIQLKNRVEARMALVDITATNEDNLLQPDELRDLIADDLSYRDKQLMRMKDEILDLEDLQETVTLNEFTLDDFRLELAKYIEANRQQLEEAPLGLYGVVPTDPTIPQIAEGVVYCLRQKETAPRLETVNPLQPYFLVYIRSDKVVRYTFTQPKQILEIYRHLCSGQGQPHQLLCDLFDKETQQGTDMRVYDGLLEKAVRAIGRSFKRRAATNLLSGRGGLLPTVDQQVDHTTDFDLITWLVIKEG